MAAGLFLRKVTDWRLSVARDKTELATVGLVGRYRPSGFFVLRTPLLPVAEFAAWSAQAVSSSASGDTDVKDTLRRALSKQLEAPHTADSLRVASPALADSLPGWLTRRSSRRRERMDRTMVQYFARMCDRCTPFGLFAGISVGELGSETRLRLKDRRNYRRRSVLDLQQVARLVRSLLKEDAIRKKVRYRVNDTLAAVGNGYQYVETDDFADDARHEVAFVEADPALTAVLGAVMNGPRSLAEIRSELATGISDPEVTEADIREYLDELVEAQVLEPELIPAVVGDDPLNQVLTSLGVCDALREPLGRVRQLREELDRLDAHGVGAPPAAYAAVDRAWTDGLGQKKTDRLLHVDMFKGGDKLRLSGDVVEELLRGAELLWRIAGKARDPLRELKHRFRERYDSREVPLAEAFDPERGLGVPGPDLRPRISRSPLLAGLDLGTANGNDIFAAGGGNLSSALAARVAAPGAAIPAVLELEAELVDQLVQTGESSLPEAVAIHFELVAASDEAVGLGDYRILYHGVMGPSGGRMLGRFCDLDSELLQWVRRHLREEEALAPDEVYAEIVHSPEGRLGNVVRRPHVRQVELSCTGRSRRERRYRLTVDDLLVRLEAGRFRLRSRRDGRCVRPRLTSAHNYRRSSGMYRFLCALQNDGVVPAFNWNWGALNGLAFLPRVVRGRAVYALARWKISREQHLYAAVGEAETTLARDNAVQNLVAQLQLPRFVRLVDGDNRLLLDLDNALCITVLADHAARRPSLILEETLAEDLLGCVSGPEGKYRNEIVLPLVLKQPERRKDEGADTKRPAAVPTRVRRIFTPGEDWLYYKFYSAPGTADRLLMEVVAPLAGFHEEIAPDEPWFFIRYGDPEPHLRVRFRGGCETRRALEEKSSMLLRPFVETGSVYRVSLDTYVREIERYGGVGGIELAESWFRADSAAALRVIALLDREGDEPLRWRAVAMGWDRLLADFGLDYERKERVVTRARESFGKEFRVGPAARRRLARRLRAEREKLEALVAVHSGDNSRLAIFDRVFKQRSEATGDIVRQFRQRDEAGELECPLDELIRSLTHMHANRIFPMSARMHELVIHDFLSRTYRSLIARSRR